MLVVGLEPANSFTKYYKRCTDSKITDPTFNTQTKKTFKNDFSELTSQYTPQTYTHTLQRNTRCLVIHKVKRKSIYRDVKIQMSDPGIHFSLSNCPSVTRTLIKHTHISYHISEDDSSQTVDVHVLQQSVRVLDR